MPFANPDTGTVIEPSGFVGVLAGTVTARLGCGTPLMSGVTVYPVTVLPLVAPGIKVMLAEPLPGVMAEITAGAGGAEGTTLAVLAVGALGLLEPVGSMALFTGMTIKE